MATAVDRVRLAERLGVERIFLEQTVGGRDAGATAAAYGAATARVTIGTAVLPMRARHPLAMAQLAATLDDLSGGRFVLGIGSGHSFINEFSLGLPPMAAVRGMREYLTVLRTFLREGRVDFTGEYYAARAACDEDLRRDVPVYLGAVRPRMIHLAVEHADGLLLWMCPPRYVAEHVVPVVRAACREFGRDPAGFPILAGVTTYVPTDAADRDRRHTRMREIIARYSLFPSYRHVFDVCGGAADLIDELAIIGDHAWVRHRMAEYRAAGCTPMLATPLDDREAFADLIAAARG